MEVIYPRACGLDVHKRSVTAGVLLSVSGRPPVPQRRTFPTMPAGLHDLAAWLTEVGVTHVAMERTGISGNPVWAAVRPVWAVLLVNAAHVKQAPGRKTAVSDAEWLAALLRHGLVRGSCVPDQTQQDLRALTRLRTIRVEGRAAAVQRLPATLEAAGLRLPSVITDITGVSARAIRAALLAGESDPQVLAELVLAELVLAEVAKGRLRRKRAALLAALAAPLTAHQRFLIGAHLALIDDRDEDIAQLDALIADHLGDVEAEIARLTTIPGVGRRTAEVIVAEVGTQVPRFPTGKHLASWAGVCPGNDQSAGKRRRGKSRKGNGWRRRALVEAATAAGRTKDPYLGAQYRRLAARRGGGRAGRAVAQSSLIRSYLLRRDGTT